MGKGGPYGEGDILDGGVQNRHLADTAIRTVVIPTYAAETLIDGDLVHIASGLGGQRILRASSTSGSLPVVGVTQGAKVSGASGYVQMGGLYHAPQYQFSGYIGRPLYVAPTSGGLPWPNPVALSGPVAQVVGIVYDHSGMIVLSPGRSI